MIPASTFTKGWIIVQIRNVMKLIFRVITLSFQMNSTNSSESILGTMKIKLTYMSTETGKRHETK